jgi:hypothetical protein
VVALGTHKLSIVVAVLPAVGGDPDITKVGGDAKRSGILKPMTREDAIAEAKRRQVSDPGASWIATSRDGEWMVVRIGVVSTKPTGTATKPPPVAPRDDPHSPSERAAWFAGGGG